MERPVKITLFFILVVIIFLLVKGHSYPPLAFGVNFHTHSDNDTIKTLKNMGANYIRIDTSWSSIERQKGYYDFGGTDRIVNIYNQNNLEPLVILGYTNDLYRPQGMPNMRFLCNSSNPEADFEIFKKGFGEFAYHAALHFKGRVKYYEIINEVNYMFCLEKSGTNGDLGPDGAVRYVSLLREAYTQIKRADPNAVVIMSGVGTWTKLVESWWFGFMSYGGLDYTDKINTHPYCGFDLPADPTNQGASCDTMRNLHVLKQMAKDYGHPNIEVWITEWGYPTEGCYISAGTFNTGWDRMADYNKRKAAGEIIEFDSLCDSKIKNQSEENQAIRVRNILTTLESDYPYVTGFFYYDFKDDGLLPWLEHHFGLVNTTNSPKPAYYEYKNFIEYYNGKN